LIHPDLSQTQKLPAEVLKEIYNLNHTRISKYFTGKHLDQRYGHKAYRKV
jgi:hypothetical protein